MYGHAASNKERGLVALCVALGVRQATDRYQFFCGGMLWGALGTSLVRGIGGRSARLLCPCAPGKEWALPQGRSHPLLDR